jgi:hypothetical protein
MLVAAAHAERDPATNDATDAKRFRPVTLLGPITKLVTGTVARRLSPSKL